MYKINHGKVLRNARYVDQIAMADVRDYAIAAVMSVPIISTFTSFDWLGQQSCMAHGQSQFHASTEGFKN